MCEWCVDIQCFRGDFYLLVSGHGIHGLHVVQPIGNFDKNDSNIVVQGQQHFSKVLCLNGGVLCFVETRYFGQATDNFSNFFSKKLFHVVNSIRRVFDHIVQKSCSNRRCSKANFVGDNFGNCNGVKNIGLPSFSSLLAVGLQGQVKGFSNQFLIRQRQGLVGSF